MKSDSLLVITGVLGFFVFIIFFVAIIPILNFIYKQVVQLIETPLSAEISLYDIHYVTDCGRDLSCFLSFAEECNYVNAEAKNGDFIEVIGAVDGGCFLHKKESALCMVPVEEFSLLLEKWNDADDILLEEIKSEWCEESLYRWEKVTFKEDTEEE